MIAPGLKRIIVSAFALLVVIAFGLIACQSAPDPTSRPPGTVAPSPSTTPSPSRTHSPTITLTPTRTLRPTLTRTPTYNGTPSRTPTHQVHPNQLGQGIIRDLLRSNDGQRLYLITSNQLTVHNATDFSILFTIDLEEIWIEFAGMSPDGNYFATVSPSSMTVYDIRVPEIIYQADLAGAGRSEAYIQFSSDSQYMVYTTQRSTTGGPYATVCILALQVAKKRDAVNCYVPDLLTEENYFNLGYSVGSRPAINANGQIFAAAISDYFGTSIYVWDRVARRIVQQLDSQPNEIDEVALNSAGTLLVSLGREQMVRIWDVASGKQIGTINQIAVPAVGVEFAGDGDRVIVTLSDGSSRAYSLQGKDLGVAPAAPLDDSITTFLTQGYILGTDYSPQLLQYSPNSQMLAYVSGSIQLWDVNSRSLRYWWFGETPWLPDDVVFHPSGSHLAVSSYPDEILIFDTQTGAQIPFSHSESGASNLGGARSDIQIGFSPGGAQFVVGYDQTIEVWSFPEMVLQHTLVIPGNEISVLNLSFSTQSQELFVLMYPDYIVTVWDIEQGKFVRQNRIPILNNGSQQNSAMAGSDLAIVVEEINDLGRLKWWVELWDLDTLDFQRVSDVNASINHLGFNANGDVLLVQYGETAHIRRLENLKSIQNLSVPYNVEAVALGPVGSKLATIINGVITLWPETEPLAASLTTPVPSSTPVQITPTTPLPSITAAANIIPQRIVSVTGTPSVILDSQNAAEVHLFKQYGGGTVAGVDWLPLTDRLLVVGADGLLQLSPQSFRLMDSFFPPDLTITSVCQLADGRVLAAGHSELNQIQVWDTGARQMLFETEAGASPVISPDGQWLAFFIEDRYGRYDIAVWDIEDARLVSRLQANTYEIPLLHFSPDSRYIASIDKNTFHNGADYVAIWDIETGLLHNSLGGPETTITQVNFSADGQYLFGASGGDAWIWRVEPGYPPLSVALFEGQRQNNTIRFEGTVTAAMANPQGNILAIGTSNRNIWLYDLDRGVMLDKLERHASAPLYLAFERNGAELVSIDADGQLIRWDVATRRVLMRLHLFGGPVRGLVEGEDGRVTAWMQNTLASFTPLVSQMQYAYVPAHPILAFNPAWDLVAATTGFKVSLYDAQTGQLRLTLPDEDEHFFVDYYDEFEVFKGFNGAQFSPNDSMLATFGSGGIWVYAMPGGEKLGYIQGMNSDHGVYSPNSTTLASSVVARLGRGSGGSTIWLFDIRSIASEEISYDEYLDSLVPNFDWVFSPDGLFIAAIGNDWSTDSGVIDWIDVTSRESTQALLISGVEFVCISINPAADLIAAGTADGQIILVDRASMAEIGRLDAHHLAVNELLFTADGKYLVSGGADGVIKVWGVP